MTVVDVKDERAAVDKAMSLLAALGATQTPPLGVSELARRTDLSKSTAFRLLAALERNGVVERAGTAYRLGRRLHDLGNSLHSPENVVIREVVTPFLADLYERTHGTVHLAVLDGRHVVYLDKIFGHRHPASPSRAGGRAPAHATAVGKILLAHYPTALDDTLAAGLQALTPHTITDPGQFIAAILRVRRTGVAHDHEEAVLGLACTAVALTGTTGRPVAAISVSSSPGDHARRGHERLLKEVSRAASAALRRETGAAARQRLSIA